MAKARVSPATRHKSGGGFLLGVFLGLLNGIANALGVAVASEAGVHEVVLGLVQADKEIRASATEVRVTATDLSLSFTHIAPEDRLLLAQLTFAYHRRRAQ